MSTRRELAAAALAVTLLSGGMLFSAPGAAGAAGEKPPSDTIPHEQSSCLWQYIVTDGVFNDVLVFEHVNSTNVVGRIHPGEYFRSSGPPQILAGSQGVRLHIDGGWVGYGNYTVLQHCE